jgi:ribonucleoside-diphosphate reductase beta chain
MLAIGVVENKVKTFWARIDLRMPKTEVAMVGHTFAANETIHQMTYQKLLDLLGLSSEFETVMDVPCMLGRSEYLGKYLQGVYSKSDKEFTKSLILFTLLVENASLFSQFLIVSSFKKYKNVMTNFNSVISATAREEDLHAKFGIDLIIIIRKENPEWFDDDMEKKVRRNIAKAYIAECEVLDWIFEEGELDFLPKRDIQEYLKSRFNNSLKMMGYADEFDLDESLLASSNYLDVQLSATSSFDFFNEKSTDYSQNTAFDEEEIWEE